MSDASAVVLVKGDDPALVAEAVRAAVDAALDGADRGLALEELAGEELAVGSIVDAARTPPFLSERRVLVVRDVGRWNTDDMTPLIDYLGDPEPTTRLVLVAGGGQTSQKLVNAIKKAGDIVDAAAPGGRGRAAWVGGRIRAAGLRVDPPAEQLIAEHLGEDVGRLPSLLETLIGAFGDGAKLSRADVVPFLGEAGGVAPWDLTDAIDRGDTAAALAALKRLTGGGERHPLVVLASLHRHYASMLRVDGAGITSEQEAAAVLGIAPFPAKKALQQAARLGSADIGRAIILLADADLDLRGVKDWPDDLVLEILVARLSRLGPRRSAPAKAGSVRR